MEEKRSISSIIIEKIFRILGIKKKFSNKKKYKKYIENINNDNYKFPTLVFKSTIEEKEYLLSKIYFINKNRDNKYLILYLHGGAYLNNPLLPHLQFVDKLAMDLNAEIIFPLYPLLPKYNYKDAYKLLDIIYEEILNKTNKKIIFMGDSAGGGLALSFNEYLYKKKKLCPNKIVLMSPWVDISMSNKEINNYENDDPTLSKYGLKEIAKLWANDITLKDYKVSPIYGNLKSIKECLLFTGTNEILYPDIKLLQEKFKKNKVKSTLIIGKEMNHDYVLYPINEAHEAYELIKSYINNG